MPYARVLLGSAFLIPSVLSGQTPATAPPDALFHAVTYVETRAPAAKAARATLEQDPCAASRKQDGLMRVESFEQIGRPGHFATIETSARSEDVRRAQCRAAEAAPGRARADPRERLRPAPVQDAHDGSRVRLHRAAGRVRCRARGRRARTRRCAVMLRRLAEACRHGCRQLPVRAVLRRMMRCRSLHGD